MDNTNFGTYLQALATALSVKSIGCETEIIRYIRPSMTSLGHIRMVFREMGFLHGVKGILNTYRMTRLRNKDYQFLMKYVPVSHSYSSYVDLLSKAPQADIYMTGSDQVWNSIYNKGVDKNYFLEFAPREKKRVSYAASIGMEDFPIGEKEEVKKYLRKYSYIGVREYQAQKILKNIGIESEVVLDPTLLLNYKDWCAIASDYSQRIDEKYVLVYTVETDKQNTLIEYYAKIISEKHNLKIYQVSYGEKKYKIKCADRIFAQTTPEVFLDLMKNASYVIVSSFHGTAFAINFNKQFLTISANRFNSRIENILQITKLKSRMVSDKSINIDFMDEIDYSKVQNILSIEREKSFLFLKKALYNN